MSDHNRIVARDLFPLGNEASYTYYASGNETADRQVCHPDVVRDLRTHGFCLVYPQTGFPQGVMDVAQKRRFALSLLTKRFMAGSIQEGYVAGEHNEMFQFTSKSAAVQKPDYCHVSTAPGKTLNESKALGEYIFNGVNAHALDLLRNGRFQQDAFPQEDHPYDRWINAVKECSDSHVMTSIHYRESNPETLHATPRTDGSLLSIYSNPKDMQFFSQGKWLSLRSVPEDVVVVLCGNALQQATNGLFRATQFRVKNNGELFSHVVQLNLSPRVVVWPSSFLKGLSVSISPRPSEMPLQPLSQLSNDTMRCFVHVDSVESAAILPSDTAERILRGSSLGHFDVLPSIVVLSIFDWIRDLRVLLKLSLVSRSLRRIANTQVLCIPAAESSHIDWGAALDRIDRGVPSNAREQDRETAPKPVDELLESLKNRWISVLGTELTETQMRKADTIVIVLARSTWGPTPKVFYKVKYGGTKLQRAFAHFAHHVYRTPPSSLRFTFGGRPLDGNSTAYDQGLEMNSTITVHFVPAADDGDGVDMEVQA